MRYLILFSFSLNLLSADIPTKLYCQGLMDGEKARLKIKLVDVEERSLFRKKIVQKYKLSFESDEYSFTEFAKPVASNKSNSVYFDWGDEYSYYEAAYDPDSGDLYINIDIDTSSAGDAVVFIPEEYTTWEFRCR